ncbi:hypothetical protein CIW48_01590 [Methylobacterium sp. P1-11]|uniref:hypothetical protein n=1 Tax=Methylobacterium sp. P1-11 TaxID=2024616 RepID=UPI0011EC0379|nr:hypothetical protein [Methylobacterium sp. P1-11]KAA0125819.1 hypothetical protein CIW48_01590 [Methylobacterium sp. P1-11]
MTSTALAVMMAGVLGAFGIVVFAVDWVPGSVVGLPNLPTRRVIGLWLYNGALSIALAAWLVCTYFCTVDGYDAVPAVRDSYCRPAVAAKA